MNSQEKKPSRKTPREANGPEAADVGGAMMCYAMDIA
jgi:hypothetical protein